jgi:hypothetical protein
MAPNLEDLLVQAQRDHAEAARRRERASAEISAIIDGATRSGRSNLTGAEDARVTALFRTRDGATADFDSTADRVARVEALAEEERAYQRTSRDTRPTGAELPSREGARMVDVSADGRGRTYNRESDRTGSAFVRDVGAAFLTGDVGAVERLQRHRAEERVDRPELQRAAGDTNTGNWAGLVVPQYATDMYAPAVSARRPLADHCQPHVLPEEGMSLNISRVTTPSNVSLQATELTVNPNDQSMDDTLLTLPVLTALGDQTISRQAVERGTGIDDVVLADLMARCAATLDSTLITQAVTGLSAVATAVSYVDATPTVPELYPLMLQAQSASEGITLGPRTDLAVMHSRRWAWLTAHQGSTWPFVNQSGIPPQSVGQSDPGASYESGIRGRLPNGTTVLVDNNISTTLGAGTEDEIYFLPSVEAHLWEPPNAPMFIRAEQPKVAALGVVIVVYEYFAYTFSRYPAGTIQKIAGSGLIAPNFVTA